MAIFFFFNQAFGAVALHLHKHTRKGNVSFPLHRTFPASQVNCDLSNTADRFLVLMHMYVDNIARPIIAHWHDSDYLSLCQTSSHISLPFHPFLFLCHPVFLSSSFHLIWLNGHQKLILASWVMLLYFCLW